MGYASHGKITEGVFHGLIRTYGYKFTFKLNFIPVENRQSDNSPTHEVLASDQHGTVKIGIAWEGRLSKGNFAGKTYFKMIVNDPSFDREMEFVAFPINNAGDYDVNLERVTKETGQSRAGQAGVPTTRVDEEAQQAVA